MKGDMNEFMIVLFKIDLVFYRCCLQLITDRPAAIQEELDLIQALGYLEEFGVKTLPLQGVPSAWYYIINFTIRSISSYCLGMKE
jgi:hypothetical protein